MHNLIFKAGVLLTLTSSPVLINSPEYSNVSFKEFNNEIINDTDLNIEIEKTDYSRIVQIKNDIKQIEYYSNVFELNSEILIDKFKELTNNFEYGWIDNYKELNIYNQELNNILKLKPGSVTPLGIINDKDNIVTLIIDNELKGKKILVHPNTNTKTIVLSYDDLIKFIEFEKHNYILIS